MSLQFTWNLKKTNLKSDSSKSQCCTETYCKVESPGWQRQRTQYCLCQKILFIFNVPNILWDIYKTSSETPVCQKVSQFVTIIIMLGSCTWCAKQRRYEWAHHGRCKAHLGTWMLCCYCIYSCLTDIVWFCKWTGVFGIQSSVHFLLPLPSNSDDFS